MLRNNKFKLQTKYKFCIMTAISSWICVCICWDQLKKK